MVRLFLNEFHDYMEELKKEMARIKEENEILHQRRALAKKAMAIFATRN